MTKIKFAVIVSIVLLGTVFAQPADPQNTQAEVNVANHQVGTPVSEKKNNKQQSDAKSRPEVPPVEQNSEPASIPLILTIITLALVLGQLALTLVLLLKYFGDRRQKIIDDKAMATDIESRVWNKDRLGAWPDGKALIPWLVSLIDMKLADRLTKIQPVDGPAILNDLKEIKQKLRNLATSNPADDLQRVLNDLKVKVEKLELSSSAFSENVDRSRTDLQQLLQSVQNAQLLQDLGKVRQIITDAVNEIGDRKTLEAECRNAKAELQKMQKDMQTAVDNAAAAAAERDVLQTRFEALQKEKDGLASNYSQLEKNSRDKISAMETASREQSSQADVTINKLKQKSDELQRKSDELQGKYDRYEAMDQQSIPDFMINDRGLASFFEELKKLTFDERISEKAVYFKHALALLPPAILPDSQFKMETWMLFKILGKSLNAFLRAAGKTEEDIARTMKCFSAALNRAAPTIKAANGTEGKAFTIIVPDLGQSINVQTAVHTANGAVANKILNWGVLDVRGNCQLKAEVA